MWRGFPVESFIDQCLSNVDDLNKGRQMPVFYGSADLNYVTLSPTLATQMPQGIRDGPFDIQWWRGGGGGGHFSWQQVIFPLCETIYFFQSYL